MPLKVYFVNYLMGRSHANVGKREM
jgi:hypothetical protein